MRILVLRVVAAAVLSSLVQLIMPRSSLGSFAKLSLFAVRTVLILEPITELLCGQTQ